MFFKFPVRTLSILWVSDFHRYENYVSKINLIIFFKWGILTTFYYPKTNGFTSKFGRCMYKSDFELNYIDPLGSEISLGI